MEVDLTKFQLTKARISLISCPRSSHYLFCQSYETRRRIL